ncbi:MAG: type II secretion system F family protein [Bryobacterales bacterium]
MAEFVLKYADAQGAVHQQMETAETEELLRQRYSERGLLVYSVRARRSLMALDLGAKVGGRISLEQFLIFNQQFVTLIRAGLPILKALELLRSNIQNRKLAAHIESIYQQVRTGIPISQAFRARQAFPPIYTTSLMAGEKSGSLPDVIDRFVQYQKVALAVRKKIIVSLIYPALLVTLVLCLIFFLVTYVVPEFAALYDSMDATLPYMTQLLVAFGVTLSEHLLLVSLTSAGIVFAFLAWMRSETARDSFDRFKRRIPIFGAIWLKYQVAQIARLLSTLLQGGIPLVQALETAGESMGSRLMQNSIQRSRILVKEGQALSTSMAKTGVFPDLAVQMVQVGESTGALPAMLDSVAEFFEDDVNTRMTAVLSLIEPAIMIFMGLFVAFVLIALYLPIFTLAERI